MNKKVNTTVFASGSGTDFQSLIDGVNNGICPNINIVGLITNKIDAGAIKRAKKNKIPAFHISVLNYNSEEEYNKEILNTIKNLKTDIIFLAGYLRKIDISIIKKYKNRIYNIHPSLLPKYGGDKMYGLNVHKAVIEAKERYTGATIHMVDVEYDTGAIICQVGGVPVLNDDTPEALQKRVLEIIEHKMIPTTFDIISRCYLIEKER